MPGEINSEQVVWSGTVSQWHYLGKWLLVIILLAALGASFKLVLPDMVQTIVVGRWILVVLAVVSVIYIQVDRSRRKYSITNKRVVVEYGLISKTSNEIRVQDIRSINLTKSGLSGLFGIGRIEFSSAAADDAEVVFWNCPDAEKVRDQVRLLQV